MEKAGFLFSAYGIVWAVLFLYVLILVRRQGKLRREIERLKDALKKKEAK